MATSDAELVKFLNTTLPISSVPDDLYVIFCETMHEDLTKLLDAANKNDVTLIRSLAHRIKGAFDILNISIGSLACQRIGQLLIEQNFTQIHVICEKLQSFLSEFLGGEK